MAKKPTGQKPLARNASPRDGYDPPLVIYFPKGTRAKIRAGFGKDGEAPAIRKLIAEHLHLSSDRSRI